LHNVVFKLVGQKYVLADCPTNVIAKGVEKKPLLIFRSPLSGSRLSVVGGINFLLFPNPTAVALPEPI